MRYARKWPVYAADWDRMVIKADRLHEFVTEAEFAIENKAIYQEASEAGFPWAMVAVVHRREADCNFDAYLGNGQLLKHKTTEVPKGRGPFLGPKAFIDGCIDAVRQEGWASVHEWPLERVLYHLELFNGAGYNNLRGGALPSPYLWGGTNIQKPGKFIADRKFSKKVMDKQPGCAPLLQQIMKLDPSVTLMRES
jgi:lysozyme family protein